MALTGEKVKGRDLAKCGIATNYVPSEKMDSLKSIIIEKSNEDISLEKLQEIVNEYSDIVYSPENFSFPKSDEILRTFVLDDINEIFIRLQRLVENGSEGEQTWAKKTLSSLSRVSPFSLVVTFEQMKKGTIIQSLEEAFNIEAQMVSA
jgi:3-hydroxyisobutyryl-CoA hydrolase